MILTKIVLKETKNFLILKVMQKKIVIIYLMTQTTIARKRTYVEDKKEWVSSESKNEEEQTEIAAERFGKK